MLSCKQSFGRRKVKPPLDLVVVLGIIEYFKTYLLCDLASLYNNENSQMCLGSHLCTGVPYKKPNCI